MGGGANKWKNPNVSFKVVISSKRKKKKRRKKKLCIYFTEKKGKLVYYTVLLKALRMNRKFGEPEQTPGGSSDAIRQTGYFPAWDGPPPRAARRPTPPSPLLGPAGAGRSVWRPLPGRQGGRGGGEEGKS